MIDMERMTQGFPGGSTFTNIPLDMQPIVNDITTLAAVDMLTYYVELEFFNSRTNVSHSIPIITKIDIVQNFEEKIADSIELDVQVSKDTKQWVMDNFKDMYCWMKIYFYDSKAAYKSTTPIIDLTWLILVKNRASTSKFELPKQREGFDGNESAKNALEPLTVSLYNPDILKMKTYKTCGNFRNSTVANLIGYLATVFDVKTMNLIPPHNEEVIENLLIEPMHYIMDIFDYLQKRYGIYRQGVSIYYTHNNTDRGVLYVYPKYEYEPVFWKNKPIEIYYIGNGNMISGSDNYRIYSPDSEITYKEKTTKVSGTKIICNHTVSAHSASEIGADRIGTLSLMYNANRTVDRWRHIKVGTGNVAVPVHNLDLLDGMKVSADFTGFTTVQYNPRYDVSYNNPYLISELLSAVNCDIVVLHCSGMRPWLIEPGQLINFVYSKSVNSMVKVPGICSSAIYSFIKTKSVKAGENVFQCDATFTLKLKMENMKS